MATQEPGYTTTPRPPVSGSTKVSHTTSTTQAPNITEATVSEPGHTTTTKPPVIGVGISHTTTTPAPEHITQNTHDNP